MGRHYRKKDSFMKGLLKLMLLAVLSFALLFAACLLYPDRFSPTAVNMAERITLSAGILRSKIAACVENKTLCRMCDDHCGINVSLEGGKPIKHLLLTCKHLDHFLA